MVGKQWLSQTRGKEYARLPRRSGILPDRGESGIKGLDKVVDVLGADGKSDGVRLDPLLQKLGLGELGVRRGSRVDNQRLNVRNVGKQGEYRQVVDELLCVRRSSLYLEGEDGSAAVREVLLVQLVSRLGGEGRVVYGLYLRVLAEVLNYLQRVEYVALHAQGESLQTLKEYECVERRNGCARVTQEDSPDVCNECRRAYCVGEADAVIGRVRLGDPRICAGLLPVEIAAVNDNAADGRSVAADELCRGVYHDISAVLDGTEQVRSCKRAVNYQRDIVVMRDLRELLNVGYVGVRVAEGLNVQRLCVPVDSRLEAALSIGVNELRGDPVQRERVRQQVVSSAVDGVGGYDVLSLLCKSLDGVGDSRRSGSRGESCNAALEGCDTLLENVLCGVSQSAVDVACVSKSETGRRMSGVLENIRGRGVYRYCACVGRGVGLLLSNVEL